MSEESSSSPSESNSDSEDHVEEQSLSDTAGPENSEEQRARSETQWPTDQVIVTRIDEEGMPIPKKEKQRMRTLAGLIARQKVSVLLPKFTSLGKDGKRVLFSDYVMPYLKFNKEMQSKGYRKSIKAISNCWRNYKSTLVKFMRKGKSPFNRFKHLKQEDWDAFVQLKRSEEFQQISERMKVLREKNKHPHHLGTTGYDGKKEVWAAEDDKLANEGQPNPWLVYPNGRGRSWLRARGKLMPSGEIVFGNQETMEVSDRIIKHSRDSSSSTGKDDVLTKALGNPEHPGRVRGVSSSQGWTIGLPGYKRKRINEEYLQEFAKDLQSRVVKDVIANMPNILAAQGLKIVPISPSPNGRSPAEARRSSCSSIDAPGGASVAAEYDLYNEMMQQGEVHISDKDASSIGLLTEPTSCILLANIEGYQVQVAMGQVHPHQTVLHNVPLDEGFVVVFVDSVIASFRDQKLERPVNDEVTTLGEAVLQRVQWRRGYVVIDHMPPQKVASQKVPNPIPKPPHVAENRATHSIDQATQRGISDKGKNTKKAKCTQSDKVEDIKKLKNGRSSQDSATGKKVVVSTSAAKSTWSQPHSKFQYGKPLMALTELKKVGSFCNSLHRYYLEGCKENKKAVGVFFKGQHLLRSDDAPFSVDYTDLYDLFNFDALDMSILRLFALYMYQESKMRKWPVAILDPQMMALSTIEADKDDRVFSYVARAMTLSSKEDFIMFPCNTGGHWIAVVISLRWNTVWYLNSLLEKEYNVEVLTKFLNRAWDAYIAGDAKRKNAGGALRHRTKFPCHQQQVGNACGFYCCHHMIAIAGSKIITKPESIILSTSPVDGSILYSLREILARFLMSEVISPNGEYHDSNAKY